MTSWWGQCRGDVVAVIVGKRNCLGVVLGKGCIWLTLNACGVAQDFGGFRVLVILPRYVPQWPPPSYLGCQEGTRSTSGLGAPLKPLPILQTHSKPVCAATIRSGPGYLEIPFVATHEGKRGRGYCRWEREPCLLAYTAALQPRHEYVVAAISDLILLPLLPTDA